ncbi:hypothetical protein BJV77DRAFT_202551 [Russula vinacea]|nr:hypothetical protein BJV77DRAFT_202551 [Russula vinacea]
MRGRDRPVSISSQCQSSCTTIIKKLDAARVQRASVRRRTLPLLGFALIASLLSDRVSPTKSFRLVQPTWIPSVWLRCIRIELEISCYGTPTGTASTGDPLSMFEAPTPTSGATAAVTYALPPLIPTQAEINTKIGSAIGLNALEPLARALWLPRLPRSLCSVYRLFDFVITRSDRIDSLASRDTVRALL